jgi:C-terminal processing protease CtpA/Prc
LGAAQRALAVTNKLTGVVLDLRFAGGDDYAAAQDAAKLFSAKKNPRLPLVVLVNHDTRAAAEALAAELRVAGAGLILGSVTAGQAALFKEYVLRDGSRVRLASEAVKLSDGSAVSLAGVKPDIAVEVSAADEHRYFDDAYSVLTNAPQKVTSVTNVVSTATNKPPHKRMTEADLVRKHREGLSEEEDDNAPASREPASDKPALRDPALVRAVDLLKALAVVRQ